MYVCMYIYIYIYIYNVCVGTHRPRIPWKPNPEDQQAPTLKPTPQTFPGLRVQGSRVFGFRVKGGLGFSGLGFRV